MKTRVQDYQKAADALERLEMAKCVEDIAAYALQVAKDAGADQDELRDLCVELIDAKQELSEALQAVKDCEAMSYRYEHAKELARAYDVRIEARKQFAYAAARQRLFTPAQIKERKRAWDQACADLYALKRISFP